MNDKPAVAVLYHAHCADGFGAAWAAWQALGERARYVPVQYGSPLPDLGDATVVYLLDFSYPRATLDALTGRADLYVIDHHKTAQADLAGAPYAQFDMDQSGAVLAWRYFHPKRYVPLLLQYVQDRDLWRWELAASRAVSAALWSYPMEFDVWSQIAERLERRLQDLVNEGAAILRYMEQQTAMICAQAHEQDVGGYRVPTVNATSLWSEVGEELLRRYPEAPFAAAYYDLANGLRKWSLRSQDHRQDVSAVAKALGGGGHRNAAGFEERR